MGVLCTEYGCKSILIPQDQSEQVRLFGSSSSPAASPLEDACCHALPFAWADHIQRVTFILDPKLSKAMLQPYLSGHLGGTPIGGWGRRRRSRSRQLG